MAKLNFNTVIRPTLELTMMDEGKTVITVTSPSEGLVEELEATLPELQNTMNGKDAAATDLCYDLAARLISCNREGLQVTVEDLRSKYWPADHIANLLYLTMFYSAYLDFIQEINNAKN